MLKIASELSESMRLPRPPEIRESNDSSGPLVFGWTRPVVLLPDRSLDRYGEPEWRMALAHEFAHLRRRDLRTGLIPIAVGALFWFNPLAWLARREWRIAVEAACDERAMGATNASLGEYGSSLLRRVEESRSSRVLGAMGAASDRRILERRLNMIGFRTPRSTGERRLGWGLIAALGALCLLPWRLRADESRNAMPSVAKNKTHSITADAKGKAISARIERDLAKRIMSPESHDDLGAISVTVPVERGAIAGKAIHRDGEPASGAIIDWISRNEKGDDWIASSTVTDGEGRFAFENAASLSRQAKRNQLRAEGSGAYFTDVLRRGSDEIQIVLDPWSDARMNGESERPIMNPQVRVMFYIQGANRGDERAREARNLGRRSGGAYRLTAR